MIENPDQFIRLCGGWGDRISVHQEACVDLNRTLHLIHSQGVAGPAWC